jgi:hypothetical protein
MAGDRLVKIFARLSAGSTTEPEPARLCEVCADVSLMTGAGIMLMTGDVQLGSVCSSNAVSNLIEELQFTLGEGPCVDAHHENRPVLEPDLVNAGASRWLAFTPPTVAAGARAVFGFPLQMGGVRLGALNLYRDQPGPMNDDQYADVLVLADVVAQTVLSMQSQALPGALGPELEGGANFRFVVHQASGMVAVQLGISVGEALVRLRAYAFGNDRLLAEVAEAVVARKLRFDGPETGGSPAPPGA